MSPPHEWPSRSGSFEGRCTFTCAWGCIGMKGRARTWSTLKTSKICRWRCHRCDCVTGTIKNSNKKIFPLSPSAHPARAFACVISCSSPNSLGVSTCVRRPAASTATTPTTSFPCVSDGARFTQKRRGKGHARVLVVAKHAKDMAHVHLRHHHHPRRPKALPVRHGNEEAWHRIRNVPVIACSRLCGEALWRCLSAALRVTRPTCEPREKGGEGERGKGVGLAGFAKRSRRWEPPPA